MKLKSNTDINHKKTVKLGEEIRQLRKAHSMTLSQLSEACGCSVSFLSKIERNQARPSLTAMQEIAEALGAPVGWFFSK